MKKFKEEKGITLVALIITIVVLLILAVVSIGAVQNSGIIGHAQNAAAAHQEGTETQGNTITDMETLLNNEEMKLSIPKYTEEEKEELLNLIMEYGKAMGLSSPEDIITEEERAIGERVKAELLKKGMNPDEMICIYVNNNEYINYFYDKKIVLGGEDEVSLREVTAEEIKIFEELYKRAKFVDEKLDRGEYTTSEVGYYFDYNGETLEFLRMAGPYKYSYNSQYALWTGDFSDGGRCLGL